MASCMAGTTCTKPASEKLSRLTHFIGKKGRILTCPIECPHMARATPLPVAATEAWPWNPVAPQD